MCVELLVSLGAGHYLILLNIRINAIDNYA